MTKIFRRLCLYALASTLLYNSFQVSAQTDKKRSSLTETTAGGISSYTLANGFKIILIPFPTASNVRVELLVKTGSKLEGYGETGMAHFARAYAFQRRRQS
jgi:predicted Zn-dependent peptidase